MQLITRLIFIVIIGSVCGCVSTSHIQEMSADIEKLKKESSELKESVDRLETDLAALTETQEPDLPADEISEIADSITSATPTPVPPPPAPPAPSVLTGEEWYDRGQSAYHAGRYREAVQAFEQAAAMVMSREFKARCYYWEGECLYAQKSYRRALELFNRVYLEYRFQPKAPDALLKIGFTYTEMEAYNEAVQVLKEFVTNYPDHRAVSLARDKLEWIDSLQAEGQPADSTRRSKESRR